MESAKLVQLYDFRQIPIPEVLLTVEIQDEELKQKEKELGIRFSSIESVETPIQEQDIIVITLPEMMEKSNVDADYRNMAQAVPGKVQINVGKGVYDAQWETELIGKKIGDEMTLPKRGQYKSGIITQIKRRHCPPVTDELAARLGMEEIATLADYRQYWAKQIEEREKQKKLRGIHGLICKEMVKRCEFAGLPEDQEEAARVQMSLITSAIAKRDGIVCDQKSYEALVEEYVKAGMDREEILTQLPYDIYLQQTPFAHFGECIINYYEDKMKAVIV